VPRQTDQICTPQRRAAIMPQATQNGGSVRLARVQGRLRTVSRNSPGMPRRANRSGLQPVQWCGVAACRLSDTARHLGSRPGSRLCCTTSSPTPPRARSLACPELALGATRRPVLTAVSNQVGADVRAMTARLLAAGGSAARERDALMPVTWAEGVTSFAIAGAGSTCIPGRAGSVQARRSARGQPGRRRGRLVAGPERHCAAVVGAAGARAVIR